MKKITHPQWLAVIALGIALAVGDPQTACGSTTNLWQFATGATNSSPVGGGAATATAAPGPYNTGWKAANQPIGNVNGMWDLGRYGTLTFDHLSEVGGNLNQSNLVTVSVRQYLGWPFGLVTVSIPGAQCLQTNQFVASLATGGLGGQWVVNETLWNLPPRNLFTNAVITSANNGSLVDQVAFVSTAVTVTPISLQLTIQPLGTSPAKVKISWAASLTNQLQATADLSHPNWTTVALPATVVGDIKSITLDATAAMQFFRLQ